MIQSEGSHSINRKPYLNNRVLFDYIESSVLPGT